jgi:hypothetical protein
MAMVTFTFAFLPLQQLQKSTFSNEQKTAFSLSLRNMNLKINHNEKNKCHSLLRNFRMPFLTMVSSSSPEL